jgi:hypothetical protein
MRNHSGLSNGSENGEIGWLLIARHSDDLALITNCGMRDPLDSFGAEKVHLDWTARRGGRKAPSR